MEELLAQIFIEKPRKVLPKVGAATFYVLLTWLGENDLKFSFHIFLYSKSFEGSPQCFHTYPWRPHPSPPTSQDRKLRRQWLRGAMGQLLLSHWAQRHLHSRSALCFWLPCRGHSWQSSGFESGAYLEQP